MRPTRTITRWWKSLEYLTGEWRGIIGSSLLASGAALGEAGALVLVVSLADALAGSSGGIIEAEVGPVSLELTFREGLIAAAISIVLSVAGRIAAGFVLAKGEARLMSRWRTELIAGFLKSRYEFETGQRAGDLIEAAGNHAKEAAGLFGIFASALNSVIGMIIFVVIAFALDPMASTILVIGGSLLLVALRPALRRTRALATRETKLDVDFGNQADEIVAAARDIKIFGAAPSFRATVERIAAETARAQVVLITLGKATPVVFQAAGILILLAVLAIASTRAEVNISGLAGAAILLYRGLAHGQQLSSFQQQLSRKVPYADRLRAALSAFELNEEEFGAAPLDRVESVEVDNVSYEYHGDDLPAVRNVHLIVKKPGIVGFVGPSGSGKSTLAQLVLRLRIPSKGKILINGVDALSFDAGQWQRAVSFVPQETALLHSSVAENIAYFRDWLPRSAIEMAAEKVGLTDHIRSLPDGFDTVVGPTIREFSGGQRQRIGIARALAGNPSLVVLDEPTSALDSETEAWVMSTLNLLRQSTIVILITHRESTMRHCDAIVRFHSGRVTLGEAGQVLDY